MIKTSFMMILFMNIILCASSEDEIRKRLQALYGENKEISGNYDTTLSVTCNNGIFVGKKKENIISYKGIPYAKPPIGNLRWKDPVAADNSTKVYEAYYFGKAPIQTDYQLLYGSYYKKGEDCLHLNIWVNSNNNSNKKAVIVYIHGGSYTSDSTSNPKFDGHNLIKKYSDVILVTVDFRLNILGFINFESVPGGENYKTTNNLGLLDIICALKWIKKNIANFGGDPNKITIMGHSSGGASVSLLPLIQGTDGLFKRIIDLSGPLSITFSKDEAKLLTKKFLQNAGKYNMDDLVALSEDEIIEIEKKVENYGNFAERDGNILPEDLYEQYKNGKTKNIDILLGSTKDEVRYWILSLNYAIKYVSGELIYKLGMPIMYESDLKKISDYDKQNINDFLKLQNGKKIWKLTELYNDLVFRVPLHKQAEYHSDSGGKAFVYQWRYPGENEELGAFHGIELSYIFNNLNETQFTGNKVNYELANKVQDMFINFAKNGNPSTSEITWEPYDSDKKKILVIDENIEMVEDYNSEQSELLEPLLKYYINGNYAHMSFNVPQVYKMVALLIAAIAIIIIALKFIFKFI